MNLYKVSALLVVFVCMVSGTQVVLTFDDAISNPPPQILNGTNQTEITNLVGAFYIPYDSINLIDQNKGEVIKQDGKDILNLSAIYERQNRTIYQQFNSTIAGLKLQLEIEQKAKERANSASFPAIAAKLDDLQLIVEVVITLIIIGFIIREQNNKNKKSFFHIQKASEGIQKTKDAGARAIRSIFRKDEENGTNTDEPSG